MKISFKNNLLYLVASTLMLFACSSKETENNTKPPITNTCTAGEAGCDCTTEMTCTDGSMCTGGKCACAMVKGLQIQSDEARSCEVMFQEASGTFVGATYADGVKGSFRRHAPKVALAISQTKDEKFPSGAVKLQISGVESGVKIKTSKCFNAAGKVIEGADVVIQ